MPWSCSVYGCSGKSPEGKSFKLYSFPKDQVNCAKWIHFCGRKGNVPSSGHICERHFSPQQYARDLKNELLGIPPSKNARLLKLNAFPDTNLPTVAQTMNVTPEAVQDDELTIPRASMNKMIKELLPNVRVANEARELILNCCTEFIHLVSSEANEICNQQQKKTINAEHILASLDKLGFGDYRADAEAVLKDCKAMAAKKRRKSTRLENLGIPEEELLRQQQELFAKARQEQMLVEQQQWQLMQAQVAAAQQQQQQLQQEQQETSDEEDYS